MVCGSDVSAAPADGVERKGPCAGATEVERPGGVRAVPVKLRMSEEMAALLRIDDLLKHAKVSEEIGKILATVVFERGWHVDRVDTVRRGLVEALLQKVEGAPTEAEQLEILLEDDRAPVRAFNIAPTALPKEFSNLDDAKYEAYRWENTDGSTTHVVVMRDGQPFHGHFSFLSMKRFDAILAEKEIASYSPYADKSAGTQAYTGNPPAAEIVLDRGRVVALPDKKTTGVTTFEVVPENALEGARNEPIDYYVVTGASHSLGHIADVENSGVDDDIPITFRWRWKETREIFPGVGQVLAGALENGAVGYVDLDQRRTVVFPRQLTVSGLGVLKLSGLRGTGNTIAQYVLVNGSIPHKTVRYEMVLEAGVGTSAPAGRLRRL